MYCIIFNVSAQKFKMSVVVPISSKGSHSLQLMEETVFAMFSEKRTILYIAIPASRLNKFNMKNLQALETLHFYMMAR